MLHARAGMYRLTPPVVARGAPQLTCPRYGSGARGVVQACSAWRRGVPFPPRLLVVSCPSRYSRLRADLWVAASPVTDGTPLGVWAERRAAKTSKV